jgi:hypothetical protein
MGDVEHAHAVAYGFVFLNQATELHWHLPTSEGHHSATSSAAELIERRTQHGFGRGVGEEQFYGVLQLVEAKPEISCSSWSISTTFLNLKSIFFPSFWPIGFAAVLASTAQQLQQVAGAGCGT